jgi:signal transduction histidine kinase
MPSAVAAWFRREFGESWGIRNLEGIGDPNDPENRSRIIRLSACVGAALGSIAFVSFLANLAAGVEIAEYRPLAVLLVPTGGAIFAGTVYVFADRFPLWFVHVGAVIVNIALLITAYNGGEIFVFVLMPYIAVGTVLAMICRTGPLILHLISIAAAIGYVIVVRSDVGRNEPSTALAGFVVVMGILATSAGVGTWIVTRVRALARREHEARHDTEVARAELEVVSKHKSAFLANMSHELRTPLNAIIGFSDLLDQEVAGGLTDKQREYVVDIRSSGHHLLSLINDVLDLAKVEAGRYDLVPTRFALSDALIEGARIIRDQADESGITLSVSIDPNVGVIEADERKVRQIVLNLLSNAVKFTPRGGRVEVEAHISGGVAEVSVRDTGIGIAQADQDAIFDEFSRADGITAEGTGLGLALAKRFVELHGGCIWVESAPGAGSTFRFTLPVKAAVHN